jgi:hypothetical protein
VRVGRSELLAAALKRKKIHGKEKIMQSANVNKTIRFVKQGTDSSTTRNGHNKPVVPVIAANNSTSSKQEDRLNEDVLNNVDDWKPGDDDDDDEERDTSLSASVPEGIEIEPFHMDQERTDGSGYCDGDMYVLRKHDQDEEPDVWLQALNNNNNDKEEDVHNRIAMLREDQRRKQEGGESDERMDNWTVEDLYTSCS